VLVNLGEKNEEVRNFYCACLHDQGNSIACNITSADDPDVLKGKLGYFFLSSGASLLCPNFWHRLLARKYCLVPELDARAGVD
jgi:hypothetical protein